MEFTQIFFYFVHLNFSIIFNSRNKRETYRKIIKERESCLLNNYGNKKGQYLSKCVSFIDKSSTMMIFFYKYARKIN